MKPELLGAGGVKSHNQYVMLNNMARKKLVDLIFRGHCDKTDDYILFIRAIESELCCTIFCKDWGLFLCCRSYLVNLSAQ